MIETVALSKRYRRTVALRDVTLTIPDGGITALVGPNGSGKSTLMKLCIGFERPTSGRLQVCGVDPVRDRRAAVATVGYVPQSPSLYRDLTIREHIALAGGIRPGFDQAHARARLAALDLGLQWRVGDLSGGQAAQVSLALALGTRAPLLLLDEPLASLDPLARRDFLRVARQAVAEQGASIVLSSHVISEIEDNADRLLVLVEGRVVFDDTVAGAVAGHRVIETASGHGGAGIVGTFPGRGDLRHVLVRATDPALGRAADLEEVVLGYLAASRAAA